MPESFFAIKTNKAGDIIVDCQPGVLRWPILAVLGRLVRRLVSLFEWIDGLKKFRLQITSGLGLGMGLALSWVVYTQPLPTIATPALPVSHAEQTFSSIKTGSDWLPVTQYQRRLQLSRVLADELEQVRLGGQIELLGTNNGVYRYRIVEIRYVETAKLQNLELANGSAIIIHATTTIFGTDQIVLIAVPSL